MKALVSATLTALATLSLFCPGCSSISSSASDALDDACRDARRRAAVNRTGCTTPEKCFTVGASADRSHDADLEPLTAGSFLLAAYEPQDSELDLDTDTQPSADDPYQPGADFFEALKSDLKHMPRDLWSDTKTVFTDKTNLTILLIAGGASVAVRDSGADDCFEDKFDRSRALSTEWGDVFGALGNPGTHFAFAGLMYAYGVLEQDRHTYGVAKTLTSALAINGATTVLLKLAACTEVPNGEDWGWPSGHTSSSVALAAVLDEYYGPVVGIPLYLVSGLVALERMDDREHHFSDIVFGAALGYVVGKTVAQKHQPEIFGGKITPYINPESGNAGLAWVKGF